MVLTLFSDKTGSVPISADVQCTPEDHCYPSENNRQDIASSDISANADSDEDMPKVQNIVDNKKGISNTVGIICR